MDSKRRWPECNGLISSITRIRLRPASVVLDYFRVARDTPTLCHRASSLAVGTNLTFHKRNV